MMLPRLLSLLLPVVALLAATPAHAADRLTVRGGGWGHGVGMCQTGAIGRAEAGHGYREILRHYFNDAEVARIY